MTDGAPDPTAGQPNGAAAGADKGGDAKTFTQEEVQRLITREIGKIEKRYTDQLSGVQGELKKTNEQLAKALEEGTSLRSIVEEFAPKPPENDDESGFSAYEEELRPPKEYKTPAEQDLYRRFKRSRLAQHNQLQDLSSTLEEQKKVTAKQNELLERITRERDEERQQRIVADRSGRVRGIITVLPHHEDIEPLELWLDKRTVYNKETGEYGFCPDPVNKKDEVLPFDQKEILPYVPKSLLRPATDVGGSGANGRQAGGSTASAAQRVETLRRELHAAQSRGDSSRGAVAEVQRLQRELEQAKQQAEGQQATR